MRAVRLFVLAIAGLIVGGLFSSAALAQTADRDCRDYASQSEAQAALRADPTDPNHLDEDEDGVACDDFDYGPVGSTSGASGRTLNNAAGATGSRTAVAGATTDGVAKTGASSRDLALLGLGAILVGALIVRVAWGPVVLAPVAASRAGRLLDATLRETER